MLLHAMLLECVFLCLGVLKQQVVWTAVIACLLAMNISYAVCIPRVDGHLAAHSV